MNHAKALAIVVAYDIYLECCEGALGSEWRTKPVTFWHFRESLSRQMLKYNPLECLYPGDEKMRIVTKGNKRKRTYLKTSDKLTKEALRSAQAVPEGESGRRLVSSVNELQSHMEKIVKLKNSMICQVCGDPCYTICTMCPGNPPLHNNPRRGEFKGRMCSFIYYDIYRFGLCCCNSSVKKNWT